MFRNTLFLISLVLFLQNMANAQCVSGSMGVSGAGCGCLSGCNLTSLGGPNCSPAVSGDCNVSGTQIPMSTTINVPLGCTVTVTALFANRAGGCTSSGADGGDQLKVDIPAGLKTFHTGSGNSSITDSYTLAGPGSIVVSGSANRADEIITYTVTSVSSGGYFTCPSCISNLPIELIEFNALKTDRTVQLNWSTNSEKDNDYFTLEKSVNGIDFEVVGYMNGMGTVSNEHHYTLVDANPFNGISYYRLKQTDFNGIFTYSNIVPINFKEEYSYAIVPNPASEFVLVTGKNTNKITVAIFNSLGQQMEINPNFETEGVFIPTAHLSKGAYTVRITSQDKVTFETLLTQ